MSNEDSAAGGAVGWKLALTVRAGVTYLGRFQRLKSTENFP
jgi:hypothetical protein